jgi:ergothioneine biosynthesis protein EgtC
MCRLMGYLGSTIALERLLYQPEHSLMVQSYQPREMTSGVVNADGLGIGWYHSQHHVDPFTYKSTLPIWNETNLPELSRYIESACVLAYVRSATPGQALDMSNCQPFRDGRFLLIHNGFISNFRKTLYRPIRERLSDRIYQSINGTTDSEHLFALFLNELEISLNHTEDGSKSHCAIAPSGQHKALAQALHSTLITLTELAKAYQVSFCANAIVSDGHHLIASRYAYGTTAPSLYWIANDPTYPNSVIIASEPLFTGNWNKFPNSSILNVGKNVELISINSSPTAARY